jgi:hydroxyethylthiazole kinase-like uncharacterized protein yjeF
MKILSIKELKAADALTLQKQSISSIELMERAALGCVDAMLSDLSLINDLRKGNSEAKFCVLCGPGNNGGDGLVVARHLNRQGFALRVFRLAAEKYSHENEANFVRLLEEGVEIFSIQSKNDFPVFTDDELIIDALFGFGLSRPLEGLYADLADHVNASGNAVLSVDVPSGLPADPIFSLEKKSIVRAKRTYTFHCPKLNFMFAEHAEFTGEWKVIDIGLEDDADPKNYFLEADFFGVHLKKRPKFSHKAAFGHALIMAGSRGKIGAAILASKSAMRAGAGLVSVQVPICGESALHSAFPEAMVVPESDQEKISFCPRTENYDAIAFGPGVGTEKQTGNVLKLLIQEYKENLVIDADGLNLLAENKTWFSFLGPQTILTPHPGEFDRMFGRHSSAVSRWETQKEMSLKYGIILVLKGAHTSISMPDGTCFFNATGNPGMAKAGSGDVLTGIITGLLARGYSPVFSSLFGVWLHGAAGDHLAAQYGLESNFSGELIDALREVLLQQYQEVFNT